MQQSALQGIRVIDVGGAVATAYCAKLFADYGAEVINLEPDRGFPTRILPPFVAEGFPGETSGLHGYLHTNKQSVRANALSESALRKLIASADLILDGGGPTHRPEELPAADIPAPAEQSIREHKDAHLASKRVDVESTLAQRIETFSGIRSSISWFGKGGPYEDFVGSDGQCFALNAMLQSIGHLEGPPLIPTGYQAQIVGGLTAFIASQAEVLAATLGNRDEPVHLETSIFEACLCFSDVGVVIAHNTGQPVPRLGVNRFAPTYPLGVWPCKDGWLGVTVLTPGQWHAFCELLELDDLAHVPLFQSSIERLQSSDVLEPKIREKLLLNSAEELFYRGQAAGIPLARVPTMEELFGVDQFLHRKAFSDAILPDGFRLKVPVVPFRLLSTPPNFGGPVARLGEHTEVFGGETRGGAVRASAPRSAYSTLGREAPDDKSSQAMSTTPDTLAGGASEQTSLSRRTTGGILSQQETLDPGAGKGFHSRIGNVRPDPPEALTGIRIIDLTMGWAGPLATRHLADLGADVIKVEGLQRFDWWRSWEATEEWIADDGAEKAHNFNAVNRNKRGITLELEHPEGRALLLRLVAAAHAVVENFSGGVLPKLNLGYEQIREVKDDIILLSMPAFGSTGPWRRMRAYGSTVEHSSGLPHLNGYAEDPPTMHHVAYGDAVGGLNGAAALLVALQHLACTGNGQFVDLSQTEALFPLGVHGIVHYAATGMSPPREGNHSAPFAPHGVYPCRGEDQWILIQVGEESQWQALKRQTAGRLDGFGDAADRLKRLNALDDVIASWTAEYESHSLMTQLQNAGIPAAATHDLKSLFNDPHLAARGFWQWLNRPVVGRQPYPSPPYRRGLEPIPIARPAPTLGQHNQEVLGEMLGLAESDLERLKALGVIGNRPRMKRPDHAHPSSS